MVRHLHDCIQWRPTDLISSPHARTQSTNGHRSHPRFVDGDPVCVIARLVSPTPARHSLPSKRGTYSYARFRSEHRRNSSPSFADPGRGSARPRGERRLLPHVQSLRGGYERAPRLRGRIKGVGSLFLKQRNLSPLISRGRVSGERIKIDFGIQKLHQLFSCLPYLLGILSFFGHRMC